ncbi:MAG: hypothetical protein ACFB0D_05095 [Phormidesmis sp.]
MHVLLGDGHDDADADQGLAGDGGCFDGDGVALVGLAMRWLMMVA